MQDSRRLFSCKRFSYNENALYRSVIDIGTKGVNRYDDRETIPRIVTFGKCQPYSHQTVPRPPRRCQVRRCREVAGYAHGSSAQSPAANAGLPLVGNDIGAQRPRRRRRSAATITVASTPSAYYMSTAAGLTAVFFKKSIACKKPSHWPTVRIRSSGRLWVACFSLVLWSASAKIWRTATFLSNYSAFNACSDDANEAPGSTAPPVGARREQNVADVGIVLAASRSDRAALGALRPPPTASGLPTTDRFSAAPASCGSAPLPAGWLPVTARRLAPQTALRPFAGSLARSSRHPAWLRGPAGRVSRAACQPHHAQPPPPPLDGRRKTQCRRLQPMQQPVGGEARRSVSATAEPGLAFLLSSVFSLGSLPGEPRRARETPEGGAPVAPQHVGGEAQRVFSPPLPDPAERLWPASGRLELCLWRRRRAVRCHWYCRRGRRAPRVERSWSRPHPRRRVLPTPPHVRAARAARAAQVVAPWSNRTSGCSSTRAVGWRFFYPQLRRATMGQTWSDGGSEERASTASRWEAVAHAKSPPGSAGPSRSLVVPPSSPLSSTSSLPASPSAVPGGALTESAVLAAPGRHRRSRRA
ncbi:hypothetical protein BU14_1899s0001, partial [Porphyra umbilicalis]